MFKPKGYSEGRVTSRAKESKRFNVQLGDERVNRTNLWSLRMKGVK